MNALETADADRWALHRLAKARRLRDWMYSTVRPVPGGPMLEVGAGIGTFSELLLRDGADPLVLLEPDVTCADELRQRFEDDARVTVVAETLPDSPVLAGSSGRFGYVLCQNVLEHIDDDGAAAVALAGALRSGGELSVLVPAHPRLYGRLDRRFGHFRRYTRESLVRMLEGAGLRVAAVRSFNALGIPGWWLAGRTELVDISDRSLWLYEALVPLARPLEDAVGPPFGLSLVARARKV